MSLRPQLTQEERSQIRALARFLVFVLLAVAVASVTVGVIVNSLNSGQPAPVETLTP